MKRFLTALFSALLLAGTALPARAAAPDISAQAAVLMDAGSGRVLYTHNADEERPIASITKLMTALVAVESVPDLDVKVRVRREWTGERGSSMYLTSGEELTLRSFFTACCSPPGTMLRWQWPARAPEMWTLLWTG